MRRKGREDQEMGLMDGMKMRRKRVSDFNHYNCRIE